MKKLDQDKLKRFLGLLLYTIVLGLLIIYGEMYQDYLLKQTAKTFNIYPRLIFGFIFPLFTGILIALPHFLKQVQKQGRWSYDWIKFAAVGIPALYVNISYLLYITPVWKHIPLHNILGISNMLYSISGIVFGFLLLGILKKVKDE